MVNTITEIFNTFWQSIVSHLPGSPFRSFISKVSGIPYLKNLNWFFPVQECIMVLEVWLAAVTLYYGYMAIARFIRLIK